MPLVATVAGVGSLDGSTRMLHFRIIGVTWSVLCLIAAAVFAPQLWSMAMDTQYGIGSGFHDTALWTSQFLVELFLLAGALLGFGLFRLRRWAAFCTRATSALLLLYCLSFVLMSHFHIALLAVGVFGVAFVSLVGSLAYVRFTGGRRTLR